MVDKSIPAANPSPPEDPGKVVDFMAKNKLLAETVKFTRNIRNKSELLQNPAIDEDSFLLIILNHN